MILISDSSATLNHTINSNLKDSLIPIKTHGFFIMDLSIIGEITSPSEVNVSAPPYRLFMSTLLTYKQAETHFEHFPCPDYPGEEEGPERNTQCYWKDWGDWLRCP